MTLSGRPLLDTRSDQVLFVDRADEMSRVRGALNQGLNCLVVGERGIGKTSLVRALMFRARRPANPKDEGMPALLYVRGTGADTASELLARTADALARHQGDPPVALAGDAEVRYQGDLAADAQARYQGDLPVARALDRLARHQSDLPVALARGAQARRQGDLPVPDPGERAATDLIGELGDRGATGRLVIVLDDVPAGAGNTLFGALRDELWSIDLRWLVTVATDDSGALLRPPADAFFESQVELGPLAHGDSVEILRRRLGEVPDRLLEEAALIGGGNPRRLLDVARQFGGDVSQWSAFSSAAADREKALAALGRPAHMLAVELEALGGASASDDRLLSRMGWTRPRAVQVLGEMERAGLVTASSEKKGQGRPRKVYKVVSAAQFFERRLLAERRAAV